MPKSKSVADGKERAVRMIDADDAMERIKQAYEDMGVDTHGIWNKQLAEIFKTADVEDIRMCLHKILGAVAQAPTVDRPQADDIGDCNICRFAGCSECDDCVNGSQWVRETEIDCSWK